MNSMKRVMRSKKEIEKIVKEEVEKAYPEISRDVAYQTFAMVFLVLNKDYGFGRKRLLDLKDKIELQYWMMQEKPCGIDYTPEDVLRICKEKFGIDFNVSQFKEE
jgi:hypothetical protein